VNRFLQDYDKPGEIRVETPYERRKREEEAKEKGEEVAPAEQIEKPPEEIEAEKAQVKKKYIEEYQSAHATE